MERRRLLTAVLTTLGTFASGGPPLQTHVAVDANGDLFGGETSVFAAGGSLWELAKTGGVYAAAPVTIATFPADGSLGSSYGDSFGVVVDPRGDLFGLNIVYDDSGNPAGSVLYEVPLTSAGYGSPVLIHNFAPDAAAASGNLTVDAAGNVFGAVSGVGNGVRPQQVTLFEYTAAGTYRDLLDYNGNDPAGTVGVPNTNLVVDAAGNLYGGAGGIYSRAGTADGAPGLFEVPAGYTTVSRIATFTDGLAPVGQISLAENGSSTEIAGTTATDAWEAAVSGATATTVTTIGPVGPNGAASNYAAILAPDGNLYGNTQAEASVNGSAANNGTIWEAAANGDGTFAAPQAVVVFPVAADASGNAITPDGEFTTDGTNLFSATASTVFGVGPAAIPSATPTPTPTPTPTSTVVPTFTASTVAAASVSGTRLKGTISGTIVNAAGAARASVSVVAVDADGTTSVVGRLARLVNVPAGRTVAFHVPVSAVLAAGTYTLTPTITVGTTTVAASGGATVVVAGAFASFTAANFSVPRVSTAKAGRNVTFAVTITNHGNVRSDYAARAGSGSITGGLSTDGSTAAVQSVTSGRLPSIKPGRSAVVHVKFVVPASEPGGTYFPFVEYDQSGATASAVGATPFTLTG